MDEYESLGHCKQVNVSEDPSGIMKWYLPHHAVLRPSNTTTKCRVVFDASAKVSGRSLNDVMKIGAIIQSNLQSISLRFRLPLHVLATDVAKMYGQVFIDRWHTPLTRVFWRKTPSEPLRVLELTTVTYGTASAPFLATWALLQFAVDEGFKYPVAADIVKNSYYVDNALFGFDDLNEASEAQMQLIGLLQAGGFHLHKWASNNPTLLERIPESDRDELLSIDESGSSEVIKTLGLMWNPTLDALQFISIPTVCEDSATKRQVLSLISRMFDPLGLVAPVIVIGKLLMKSIWKEELVWDEELSGELKKKQSSGASLASEEPGTFGSVCVKPANVVSRGQSAEALQKNYLWWNGPLFLRSEEYQVVVPEPLSDEDVPELRQATVASAVVILEKLPVFHKYESFRKLQRVLAYVLRFCRNAKEKTVNKRTTERFPTVFEMRLSLKVIVRVVQSLHFGKEVAIMKSVIRLGERLRHSSLPYGVKHQWILPKNDETVERLIRAVHRKNLHIGPSALLAQLRRQFWILGARYAVRKVTRNCVRCFRLNPPCANQFMGDLPIARCDKAPAFVKVGVDFAGPMLIKQRGRKAPPLKGYVSVFVCMVTKGIHLEVVEDLSADAFIAAFQRFISRRGVPEQIFSDNGTNFEVTELKIFEFYQARQIEWKMIPPNAPHMDRSSAQFSAEESEDSSELEPLTPGNFMIDRPLTAIPEPSYDGIPENRLSRSQYVQRLRQEFWKRWSEEYLLELQVRQGKIEAAYTGADGLVREMDVRTKAGILKRPIHKLAPLPILDNRVANENKGPAGEDLQPAEVRDSSSTQLRERQHVMQAAARKDHAKEEWAQKEENSYPQEKFIVRRTFDLLRRVS
ncbi:uncharacterized protein LOC134290591 [Aedes albopictus]|uniref:Integrase catalytic domain-containing protein n=1 Tax=Aedes albopictus TaxID=7160 RepID=A0ABM2A7B3_AEDAL